MFAKKLMSASAHGGVTGFISGDWAVAFACADRGASMTSGPFGYTDIDLNNTYVGSFSSVGVSRLSSSGGSEDAGAFTISSADNWGAGTIRLIADGTISVVDVTQASSNVSAGAWSLTGVQAGDVVIAFASRNNTSSTISFSNLGSNLAYETGNSQPWVVQYDTNVSSGAITNGMATIVAFRNCTLDTGSYSYTSGDSTSPNPPALY